MSMRLVALSALVSLAVVLSGCDTAGSGSGSSIMPQSRTGQGALMGGVGGAALGAALGPGKALENAAIGGAVGAIGGGLVGNQMDKNEAKAYQAGAVGAPPPRTY